MRIKRANLPKLSQCHICSEHFEKEYFERASSKIGNGESGNGERGTGNGERGTGNGEPKGESLKGGISKRGNL